MTGCVPFCSFLSRPLLEELSQQGVFQALAFESFPFLRVDTGAVADAPPGVTNFDNTTFASFLRARSPPYGLRSIITTGSLPHLSPPPLTTAAAVTWGLFNGFFSL